MLTDLRRAVEGHATTPWTVLAPGLGVARRTHPAPIEAIIYEPLVCLILQGAKRTTIGAHSHLMEPGTLFVLSHAMPVVSRVETASPHRPFLSLVTHLELAELRQLHDIEGPAAHGAQTHASHTGPVEPAVVDLFERYVALAADPDAARVLSPGLRRELHFRLLRSPAGPMLRRIVRRDSHASNIARAIDHLRQTYREKVEMDALAHTVGMSPSAFYKHFKATTATTPLQYQKDLRLTEARRLLLGGDHTVSGAAYAVGYASPSQLSRDYTRKFGQPPSVDRPPGV